MPLTEVLRQHKLLLYGISSTLLVSGVIANALLNYSNFFAVAFYLSRSGGSVMAIANFCVVVALIFGKLMQQVFFGPLRPLEVERLYDRTWYFLTESLLAFTIFRDEFDAAFALMFGILLFVRCFHWLLADRVEWMDQMPYPGPSLLFHIRTNSLLLVLGFIDMLMLFYTIDNMLNYGVGGIVLFTSEYSILMANAMNSLLKYCIILHDLRRARARGGETAPPWEDKSMYVFYVELMTDFLKLMTYLSFFAAVMSAYGVPLNIIRDVYITARSFIRRFGDLVRYRNATRNMDERYPNATVEELESMGDRTCIICREEMVSRTPPTQPGAVAAAPAPPPVEGPNDTPKKLPCGHVFHFNCLRSWLERQQSCPTCRRQVLDQAAPGPNANGNGALPAPQPGQAPGPGQLPQQRAAWAGLLGRIGIQAQAAPLVPGQFAQGPAAGPFAQGLRGAQLPPVQNGFGQNMMNGAPGFLPQRQNPPPPYGGFYIGGVWHPWAGPQPAANGNAQPNQPLPAQELPVPVPTPTMTPPHPTTAPTTSPHLESVPQQDPSPSTSAKELSPREAAARAALSRRQTSTPPSGGSPSSLVSPPNSHPSPNVPISFPATSTEVPPISTTTPTPTTTPSAPPLIPLYDPTRSNTSIPISTPSLPGAPPYATSSQSRDMRQYARYSHLRTNSLSTRLPLSPISTTPAIPPTLTDAQLQSLDRLTRDAIDDRIKILENVQITAWKCMEDLVRVRSMLPAVDGVLRDANLQRPPDENPASGSTELQAAPADLTTEETLAGSSSSIKGKGKEKQPPPVVDKTQEGPESHLESI